MTFLGSMETAEGRRSRRLNPPNRFERLSDELAISVFVRTPFTSHDNVRACCPLDSAWACLVQAGASLRLTVAVDHYVLRDTSTTFAVRS